MVVFSGTSGRRKIHHRENRLMFKWQVNTSAAPNPQIAHVQDSREGLWHKPHGNHLDPSTAKIVARCFNPSIQKKSMKLVRRKVHDISQSREVELISKMLADVREHSMHSALVFGPAIVGDLQACT